MKPKDVMPISVALVVIILVPSGLGLLLAMVLGVACSLMMHRTSPGCQRDYEQCGYKR